MSRIRTHPLWQSIVGTILSLLAADAALAQSSAAFTRYPGMSFRFLNVDGTTAVGNINGLDVRWYSNRSPDVIRIRFGTTTTFGTFTGLSWSGAVVVGHAPYLAGQVGFRWLDQLNCLRLDDLPTGANLASADSVSGNGLVAVGIARTDEGAFPVRWRTSTPEILPGMPVHGGASACSYDGRVIYGYETGIGLRMFRWTEGGEAIYNSDLRFGVPIACTSDGSMALIAEPPPHRIFVWSANDGVSELQMEPGLSDLSPEGMSADGRIILGQVLANGDSWIWDAFNGGRLLRPFATQQLGYDPGPLVGVRTISADGRRIAGGNWILRLAQPCAADVDDGNARGGRDGAVTIDDLLAFLAWFDAGAVLADLDDGSATGRPDAAVTIDDLLYFLSGYSAGC